jgi:hypothetical protein
VTSVDRLYSYCFLRENQIFVTHVCCSPLLILVGFASEVGCFPSLCSDFRSSCSCPLSVAGSGEPSLFFELISPAGLLFGYRPVLDS